MRGFMQIRLQRTKIDAQLTDTRIHE